MDEQLKSNLTSSKHWLRLLYMILFAIFLYVAALVVWVVVMVQFLFALITGNDNSNLRGFGNALSQYIFEALQFLTYNSEDKPFPFSDWPEPQESATSASKSQAKPAPKTPAKKPRTRKTTKPKEESSEGSTEGSTEGSPEDSNT